MEVGSRPHIGSLRPRIYRDLELEIPVNSGARATNRRPRAYPRGFRRPLWVSKTSVVGSGLLIGGQASSPFFLGILGSNCKTVESLR
ncbi:hypothetical protein CRG98_026371 [Punica granatum]|uniref:Uncharacterized protein n=1 Tax=Punica granatum TaxID=22663 RepID=A0A2I0JAF1_PUNGR|nr:hypothetical protein CRG98_026371 [Punica granatum]